MTNRFFSHSKAMTRVTMTLLVICAFVVPSTDALVVVNPDGVKTLLNHMTAAFGVSPGDYVVSGLFIAAVPPDACQDLQNADSLKGAIVFVLRGSCSFVDKALAAQEAGAVAVVVGDDHESTPAYLQMGATDSSEADQVMIPSVFISFSDASLLNSSLPLNATLDQDGEVPVDPDSIVPNVQTLGMMLLILPVVWCGAVALYYLAKIIRERREARQRAERSSHLPVMRYQALPDRDPNESRVVVSSSSDSTASRATCHNESCAICLEDFTSEVSVKVLPCSHGFHSECIDPWIDSRSDLCPICKRSILDAPQQERGFCLC